MGGMPEQAAVGNMGGSVLQQSLRSQDGVNSGEMDAKAFEIATQWHHFVNTQLLLSRDGYNLGQLAEHSVYLTLFLSLQESLSLYQTSYTKTPKTAASIIGQAKLEAYFWKQQALQYIRWLAAKTKNRGLTSNGFLAEEDAHQILFFAFHPNHVASAIPLMERVREEGISTRLVLSLPISTLNDYWDLSFVAEARPRELGLPYAHYEGYGSGPGLLGGLAVKARMREWKRARNQLLTHPEFSELASLRGIQLAGLVERAVSGVFLRRSLTEWRLDTAKRVLEIERPGLVVCPITLSAFGEIVQPVARRMEIPSAAVQHGALAGCLGHRKQASDFILVWGQRDGAFLTEGGIAPQRVKVVGCPDLDRAGLSAKWASRLRQELGIPAGHKVVTLFTQPHIAFASERQAEEYVKLVSQVVQALEDVALVIKLHPQQDGAVERDWVEQLGLLDQVPVVRDLDAISILSITDVAVVFLSTVGYTAMALGRPVVCFHPDGVHSSIEYMESSAALVITDQAQLRSTLSRLLDDEELYQKVTDRQAAFVEPYFYKPDGQVVSRIVSQLLELVHPESS